MVLYGVFISSACEPYIIYVKTSFHCLFFHCCKKYLELSPAYCLFPSIPLTFNQKFLAVFPCDCVLPSIIRIWCLLNQVSELSKHLGYFILTLLRRHFEVKLCSPSP